VLDVELGVLTALCHCDRPGVLAVVDVVVE
jgi:hypothetical protein